ncbi:MAG: zinc ribbon domain-containing protein [SAR324 cluster bacterium]|nr:zinc ribbon domain-containing protein [SAR324 cluster bacterium]
MPLFEYKCKKCDYQFTELRKTCERDEALSCPTCKEGETKRIMSGFAFGGSGSSSGGGSSSPPSTGFT